MELTKKQAYWKSHIEAAESYEGSLVDYAREHDLEVKKLYVYKTALRERELVTTNTGFVRVAQAAAMGVSVTLPNGVKLTLANVDQPGLLERLASL